MNIDGYKVEYPPVSLYVSIANLGIWLQDCLYLLRNEALTQLLVFIAMDTRRIWGDCNGVFLFEHFENNNNAEIRVKITI